MLVPDHDPQPPPTTGDTMFSPGATTSGLVRKSSQPMRLSRLETTSAVHAEV